MALCALCVALCVHAIAHPKRGCSMHGHGRLTGSDGMVVEPDHRVGGLVTIMLFGALHYVMYW